MQCVAVEAGSPVRELAAVLRTVGIIAIMAFIINGKVAASIREGVEEGLTIIKPYLPVGMRDDLSPEDGVLVILGAGKILNGRMFPEFRGGGRRGHRRGGRRRHCLFDDLGNLDDFRVLDKLRDFYDLRRFYDFGHFNNFWDFYSLGFGNDFCRLNNFGR